MLICIYSLLRGKPLQDWINSKSKDHDDDFPIQDLTMMMTMMMATVMATMTMMMMTFEDLRSEAECEAARKTAEKANKETRKKVAAHKSLPSKNKLNKIFPSIRKNGDETII